MTTNQEYREIYKNLSDQKKLIIASPELDRTINDISISKNLNSTQRNALGFIIKDVLYEIDTIFNLTQKISKNLLIEEGMATELSKDIESYILNNLDSIENTIKQNIKAENLLNGVEDDFEEERIVVKEKKDDKVLEKIRAKKNTTKVENLSDILKGAEKVEGLEDLISFVEQLPESIQKRITTPEWLRRIKEIGLKYSLNEEQILGLSFETLFVLATIESEENLTENIENEVGVSGILAEQLTEEIKERIVAWINKSISSGSLSTSTEISNSLDIPPPNLPSEDLTEETPVLWANQALVASAQETAHTILHEQATPPTPTPPQHEGAYSFKTAPVVQPEPTPVAPQVPKPSFIENKLSQPVKPASPVTPPQSYTTDPYREPLE